MTYADLVNDLAANSKLPQRKVRALLFDLFVTIRESALEGHRIMIPELGVFWARARKTEGKTPSGGKWTRKASKALAFTPGINGGGGARSAPIMHFDESHAPYQDGPTGPAPAPRATAS